MSERTGKIVSYNSTNRLGQIQPEGGGPAAHFYLPQVTNPEPAPKANDLVVFEAPDLRKNKQGKQVQGNATSVTIIERAPEQPARPTSDQQTRGRQNGYDNIYGRRGKERGRGERKGDRRAGRARHADGERAGRPRTDESPTAPNDRRRDSRGGRRDRRADESAHRQSRSRDNRNGTRHGHEARKRQDAGPRSRFPHSRELTPAAVNPVWANPSLVLEKFIEWPMAYVPSPEHGAASAPQTTSSVGAWRLQERNRSYFLKQIFSRVYRKHEMQSVPWRAVRDRRRMLLRILKRSGYETAVKHVAALPISREPKLKVLDCAISLEPFLGIPTIDGVALRDLVRAYATTEAARASFAENVLAAIASDDIIWFPLLPTQAFGAFRLQKGELPAADWYLGTELRRVAEGLFRFVIPATAKFAVVVAVKTNTSVESTQRPSENAEIVANEGIEESGDVHSEAASADASGLKGDVNAEPSLAEQVAAVAVGAIESCAPPADPTLQAEVRPDRKDRKKHGNPKTGLGSDHRSDRGAVNISEEQHGRSDGGSSSGEHPVQVLPADIGAPDRSNSGATSGDQAVES